MRIYLIAILRNQNDTLVKYRVMDIDSKEIKEVSKESLINAIENNRWAFKNVDVDMGTTILSIKGICPRKMTANKSMQEIPRLDTDGELVNRKKYILTSMDLLKNAGTLVRFNGEIINVDLDDIYDVGQEIAGISILIHTEYKELVQEELTVDELRLLSDIDKLYESFIMLTRTLGLDCSFKYDVSGKAVVLKSYTGSSKHVIIPKFIDVIDNRAFYKRRITELSLNDGLKVIGNSAFRGNDIAEVDIPKTVTRICRRAFYDNSRLFERVASSNGYTERVIGKNLRVSNKNTIVSKQG